MPLLDNRFICKYPWERGSNNHVREQNVIGKMSFTKLLISPFYGVGYLLWQLILCNSITRSSITTTNVFFISPSIHIKEFSNSDESFLGFWGNVKHLTEIKSLNPMYVLVPYKQIKIDSNLNKQSNNLSDLRSFRSKYFFLKYFATLSISNFYFIIKLMKLCYFSQNKASPEHAYILKNYTYLLGKNLSSAIFLKLLFINFLESIPDNSRMIYTCEGQSWEFSLLLGDKKEFRFYGNLHVPYRDMDTQIKSYSLLRLIKKPKEVEFLVTGQASKVKFTEVIGGSYHVTEIEGQRFIYAQTDDNFKPDVYDKTIALYLDTNFNVNKTLISLVKQVALELNYRRLFIYDHPSLLNQKLYSSYEPLVVSNSKDFSHMASVNLFSPSTSAMIKPRFLGKVVAIYQPIEGESALCGLSKNYFFYDKKSLLEIMDLKPVLRQVDLMDIVNLDVGFPAWKRFLGNLNV